VLLNFGRDHTGDPPYGLGDLGTAADRLTPAPVPGEAVVLVRRAADRFGETPVRTRRAHVHPVVPENFGGQPGLPALPREL
jgi:hypothetical protein